MSGVFKIRYHIDGVEYWHSLTTQSGTYIMKEGHFPITRIPTDFFAALSSYLTYLIVLRLWGPMLTDIASAEGRSWWESSLSPLSITACFILLGYVVHTQLVRRHIIAFSKHISFARLSLLNLLYCQSIRHAELRNVQVAVGMYSAQTGQAPSSLEGRGYATYPWLAVKSRNFGTLGKVDLELLAPRVRSAHYVGT